MQTLHRPGDAGRFFLPGVAVPMVDDDGNDYDGWIADESGELRRAQRIARRARLDDGFEHIQPMPMSDADIDEMAWQVKLERRAHENLLLAEERSAGWLFLNGDERAAMRACGATSTQVDECYARVPERVGLVPVLSTGQRPSRTMRTPFRVTAEQQTTARAVGAFVAGGADARMAKLRRAVGFAARGHAAARKGHRPDEARMVTLTYRPGVEWQAHHMHDLTRHLRRWHARRGLTFRYVWIAEIQDGKRRDDGQGRGAIHYHLLAWVPVGAPHFPMADKQGWWPHGSTRTERADKASAYLLSYLKKSNSKDFGKFPKGARIYGVGGLDHSLRRARRWLGLPGHVQGNSDIHDDWRRAPVGTGGGWIAPDGTHWPSEFRRVGLGLGAGLVGLQRVHRHPRAIDASGPFSWLPVSER